MPLSSALQSLCVGVWPAQSYVLPPAAFIRRKTGQAVVYDEEVSISAEAARFFISKTRPSRVTGPLALDQSLEE